MTKFKEVKPHKKFISATGEELEPVATLKGNGAAICHVVIDGECYVPYLYTEESGFVETHYIFPELHAALKRLDQLEKE